MTAGAHLALAAWWRDTGAEATPNPDAQARVREKGYLRDPVPVSTGETRGEKAWRHADVGVQSAGERLEMASP